MKSHQSHTTPLLRTVSVLRTSKLKTLHSLHGLGCVPTIPQEASPDAQFIGFPHIPHILWARRWLLSAIGSEKSISLQNKVIDMYM